MWDAKNTLLHIVLLIIVMLARYEPTHFCLRCTYRHLIATRLCIGWDGDKLYRAGCNRLSAVVVLFDVQQRGATDQQDLNSSTLRQQFAASHYIHGSRDAATQSAIRNMWHGRSCALARNYYNNTIFCALHRAPCRCIYTACIGHTRSYSLYHKVV